MDSVARIEKGGLSCKILRGAKGALLGDSCLTSCVWALGVEDAQGDIMPWVPSGVSSPREELMESDDDRDVTALLLANLPASVFSRWLCGDDTTRGNGGLW